MKPTTYVAAIMLVAMSGIAEATTLRAGSVPAESSLIRVDDTCHVETVAHTAGARPHYHRLRQVDTFSAVCETFYADTNQPGVTIQIGPNSGNNNSNNWNNNDNIGSGLGLQFEFGN